MSDTSHFHTEGDVKPLQVKSDSGLNVLFLAAFPLISWLFEGDFAAAANAVLLAWTFSLALRLISRGEDARRAYDAAEAAQAPRVPRKLIGAALIGLVVMVLAGHRLDSLAMPALVGLVAFGLSLAAFGCDPLRDKIAEDPAVVQRARAGYAQEQADLRLSRLADRIAPLADVELLRHTEMARSRVMRIMRDLSGDHDALLRFAHPVDKGITLIEAEAERLCADGSGGAFARRRYIAKLEVMIESLEARARKARTDHEADAFALQADRLLDRMPQDTAA